MPEWLSLNEVASASAELVRPVAWRDGRRIERNEFLLAVGRWQSAFEAQSGLTWALRLSDPCEFAASLYGAWHAGKRVVLPADALPSTLARLRMMVDGMAGELPDGLWPSHKDVAGRNLRPLDAEQVELVLFTSGSNGEPQAIEKRLSHLDAEVRAQHELFGQHWTSRDPLTIFSTVSHQHIYGLLFAVLWPLAAGCCIDTRRISYAEEMVAWLADQTSLLVSSPAHLKRLPENLDWRPVQGAVQAVLSSGGPLPLDAALRARSCFGSTPIEIYGSSETGGIAWRQQASREACDRWSPLPGVEWRIEEEVLQIRSPFIASPGWHATQDRVRAAAENSFTLLGRVDRIVKIEERRVSLSAIERALQTSPLVADARALILKHGTGMRTAAVVVLSAAGLELLRQQGRRALSEVLRGVISVVTDRIAWPRQWRYVDALPVSAQGKIIEAELQRLFADRDPAVVGWLLRDATRACVQLAANEGHEVFSGHFPAAAILPGVVQLDWAISLARQAFAVEGPVARLEVLKFQAPILPGMVFDAVLEWDLELQRLLFQYRSSNRIHASGRVYFGQTSV